MKQLLEKFNYELLHAFSFSWNIQYMVNSFVFSLDIPLIINILYEILTNLE